MANPTCPPIIRIAVYCVLILGTMTIVPFLSLLFPPRRVTDISPADYSLAYEDVTLLTQDNMKLSAWFIPNAASDNAVAICHGYPADKGDVLPMTAFLAQKYNVLYFDFRAMGKSSGRISTSGWREREDVRAAVAFLKERGYRRIGAFGFSMGAAALFLTNSPDIACIVSDSSFAALNDILANMFPRSGPLRNLTAAMSKIYAKIFLGINTDDVAPVKYISRMNIPILLIHSAGDTMIPAEQARKLHEANPASRLWIIRAGGHGESLYDGSYEKAVTDFFNARL